MSIDSNEWNKIKTVFASAQKSNMHTNIASVSPDGIPNITPMGTVFLNDDATGFLFDSFSERLALNLESNPNICISAVNSSKLFWLSSFIKGQFSAYPGVRLYAQLGELQAANTEQLNRVNARIKALSWSKGSQLIWSDFNQVRVFKVSSHRWIQYPNMMDQL